MLNVPVRERNMISTILPQTRFFKLSQNIRKCNNIHMNPWPDRIDPQLHTAKPVKFSLLPDSFGAANDISSQSKNPIQMSSSNVNLHHLNLDSSIPIKNPNSSHKFFPLRPYDLIQNGSPTKYLSNTIRFNNRIKDTFSQHCIMFSRFPYNFGQSQYLTGLCMAQHTHPFPFNPYGQISTFSTKTTFSSLRIITIGWVKKLYRGLKQIITNPKIIITWSKSSYEALKHFGNWTKTGFKLFFANLRVSYHLVRKKILGHPLKLREHKLLVRTSTDALKLIPFSLLIIIPFAEFALPIVLRLFPRILPSTFFEKQYDRSHLQRKLQAKKELASFFQELMHERTRQILEVSPEESVRDKAHLLEEFQAKILQKDKSDVNPFLSLKDTLMFAKLFKKEFVMEKMNLETLKVICQLLGVDPFGKHSHLILKLRHHIIKIQKEDRDIFWEGVSNLTHIELIDACKARAMRFYGISDDAMRDQMNQWLALSMHKDVPPLLLIWSRCITMTHVPLQPPLSEEENLEGSQEQTFEDIKNSHKKEIQEAENRIKELQDQAEQLKQSLSRLQFEKDGLEYASSSTNNSNFDVAMSHESFNEGYMVEGLEKKIQKMERFFEIMSKEISLLRSLTDMQQEQLTKASHAFSLIGPNPDSNHLYLNQELKDLTNGFEEAMNDIEKLLENAKDQHYETQMDIQFHLDEEQNFEEIPNPAKLSASISKSYTGSLKDQ